MDASIHAVSHCFLLNGLINRFAMLTDFRIDRGTPLLPIVGMLTTYYIKVEVLQFFPNRANAAITNESMIDADDRCDLRPCAT